ncbi:MAG: hypothetical protein JOY78_16075 [Pseudonocardia sp.]|nr:hypothetical protein [Pseudonocardia sp.]
MNTETSPGIDVEERGSVLLARLRTGPHGMLVAAVADALAELVTRAEEDDAVHAVVLTGTHPDRFVAHANVGWLARGAARTRRFGPRAAAVGENRSIAARASISSATS